MTRMGKLENRAVAARYSKLITRIETVRNDPRYAFMFDERHVGDDTMVDILGELFRLPANGVADDGVQLAGFPAEVFDAVVSVLCRMAFEFGLWSDGALPLLVVCEEAHRYAAADRDRLRADARGAVAHRQGGPQIRRVPRPRDAAAGASSIRPSCRNARPCSRCGIANEHDQAIVQLGGVRSRRPACSASCRRSAPARRSPSAKAFRCRRGCASSNCRRAGCRRAK